MADITVGFDGSYREDSTALALELADLLRPAWADISEGLRASGVPVCEGEPDPEPDPKPDPEPDPDPKPDEPEDWKAHSRRHEREAKKARKDADDLRAKLQEREDADKTDHERAVEDARKEAADAARSEATSTFRTKLLNAEVRAQAAGKFANPALAVKLLDLDLDDAFDDEGEVKAEVITAAIDEYLESEPYLKADPHNGRPAGDADGGKGKAGGKSLEELTPDEHLAHIQGR